jgi:hypothetical protein
VRRHRKHEAPSKMPLPTDRYSKNWFRTFRQRKRRAIIAVVELKKEIPD